jgi:hypothetical protein
MNPVKLFTYLDGEWVSHFSAHEFESGSGALCINFSVVRALEILRRNLSADENEEIQIIVSDGTRTQEDNERLAEKLGWTDDHPPGLVSRDTQHLIKNGACAVDFYAQRASTRFREYSGEKRRLPVQQVAFAAWQAFDFVKQYPDGHVHGDQRKGGTKC